MAELSEKYSSAVTSKAGHTSHQTYSYILIHLSEITPRFFTDPLGLIEDALIYNADVLGI